MTALRLTVSHGVLHELLLNAAGRWPERVAVEDADGAMTYGQAAERTRAIASMLRGLGVGRGERVVLATPNDRSTVAAMYACSMVGASFVILGERYSQAQFRSIVSDSEPSLVVCSDLTWGHTSAAARVSAADVWAASPADDDGAELDPPSPDDVAALIYTSGSTGSPRGIVCPHRSMLFAVEATARRLGYRGDDRIYVPIPLSFDYGLYQLYLAAQVGATIVLRDVESLGIGLLGDLARASATVVPLMPAVGSVLTRLASRRGSSVSTVRLVTNTGGHLGPGLCLELRRVFPAASILLMYGLTECKRVSIAAPDADLENPTGLGRPLDGTEVCVLDGNRVPVSVGEVGELYVAGSHLMAGYWRDDDATAQRYPVFRGRRWLRTGDAISLSADGSLHFHGRLDDQIKVRGVRCSSSEIEQAVCASEGVFAAAVVVGPDGLATLFYTGPASVDRVVAHLNGLVGSWKVPDSVVAVEQLPVSAHGKADYAALRLRLAQ